MALPIIPIAMGDLKTLQRAWSRRLPLVTIGIVAVTLLFHLYNVYGIGASPDEIRSTYGVSNKAFLHALEEGNLGALMSQFWLMSVYMFAHANWWHFASNMIAVAAFGPILEERMGRSRFAGFYLLSGFLTALIFVLSEMNQVGDFPTIGASGVTFALMGAALILPLSVQMFGVILFNNIAIGAGWAFPLPIWGLPVRWVSGLYIGLQVVGGLIVGDFLAGGFNSLIHVTSFAVGLLLVLYVPWFKLKPAVEPKAVQSA